MKKTLTHSDKYTAKAFTIDEVIPSLGALKVLLEEGISFLAELDSNFQLGKVAVRVESLVTRVVIYGPKTTIAKMSFPSK